MLRWTVVVALAVIMGFGACAPKMDPQDACNFSQNSQKQRVSWKGHLPVPLYFHSSVPQQYYAAIQRAMATWSYELGQEAFVLSGIIDGANQEVQDGYSVLYWKDTWESNSSDEQARTTIYWLGSQIREADIMVNSVNFSYSGTESLVAQRVDVESLLLHELGHALGLAHNNDLGSVMAKTLSAASARRDLSNTDKLSVACEYR